MLISNLRLNQQAQNSNGCLHGVRLVSFLPCQDPIAEPSWHSDVKRWWKPISDSLGVGRKNISGCSCWLGTTVPPPDFPGICQQSLTCTPCPIDAGTDLSPDCLSGETNGLIRRQLLLGVQSRLWTSAYEKHLPYLALGITMVRIRGAISQRISHLFLVAGNFPNGNGCLICTHVYTYIHMHMCIYTYITGNLCLYLYLCSCTHGRERSMCVL